MIWFIVGFVEEKKPEKDDSEFPASLVLMPARLQLSPGQELTGVRVGECCGFAHVTYSSSVPRTADSVSEVINPAHYQATRGEHCSKPFLWYQYFFLIEKLFILT